MQLLYLSSREPVDGWCITLHSFEADSCVFRLLIFFLCSDESRQKVKCQTSCFFQHIAVPVDSLVRSAIKSAIGKKSSNL